MSLLRARLSGLSLEYEVSEGRGDGVLLLHAGGFATWFAPLMAESALARYRRVRPHRAGYAGSEGARTPMNIADQAAHARALLDHLGLAKVHVVGHSSGGSIALQLALDARQVVGSLTLLEPALMQVPTGPVAGEALARYAGGDAAGALGMFLQAVCGPGYAAVLERVLPDALADVATDAARIEQPVLAVLGAESDAARLAGGGGSRTFTERHELLLRWFPRAEAATLPGVTHLMLLENPRAVAELLASFFGRHRLAPA